MLLPVNSAAPMIFHILKVVMDQFPIRTICRAASFIRIIGTEVVHRHPRNSTKSLTGNITLFRPSDGKMDKQFPLQMGRDQSQLLEVSDLESGIWKVRVSFSDGEAEYYSEKTIQIK